MSRASRNKFSPWIESLILNYGNPDGADSASLHLKAIVIGVGQMSLSQVQDSDGPTGLLFLSDGVLQIPAILTTSAWEHLQEMEERECFTSLLNTTVFIPNYQLQFHMTTELTRCRFFLSVGQLAATSAGPAKEKTPCCTTLPSVRQKICETWRTLLGQEEAGTQSQIGFDLTELLGEWQHDFLQAVLDDIRKALIKKSSYPVNPQPSTSTATSSMNLQNTPYATSWDVDRVTYKREKCFTVPISCLLTPEGHNQQLQTPFNAESRVQTECSSDLASNKKDFLEISESKTARPSDDDDDAEWKIETPPLANIDGVVNDNLPEDFVDEEMIKRLNESKIAPLSNPWDIFPPPGETTSSPEASPEATQTQPHVAFFTSTQFPLHISKESEQNRTGEQSDLLPYQKPLNSVSLPVSYRTSASSSGSPAEGTEERGKDSAKPILSAPEQGKLNFDEETVKRQCRKAKRKRSDSEEDSQMVLEEEEEAQISGSPPSWLFDSKNSSGIEEVSVHQQGQTTGMHLETNSTVHSDGTPFAYSYQASRVDLENISRFKVPESMLNWAVKYLVTPKRKDDPNTTMVTSQQASLDRTEASLL